MDETKIDQKRLKENDFLLEKVRRLQEKSIDIPSCRQECFDTDGRAPTSVLEADRWRRGGFRCCRWDEGPHDFTTLRTGLAQAARSKMGIRHSRGCGKSACRAGVDESYWTGYMPETKNCVGAGLKCHCVLEDFVNKERAVEMMASIRDALLQDASIQTCVMRILEEVPWSGGIGAASQ